MVAPPVTIVSAAVVGRDEQVGAAAIVRLRLQPRPQFLEPAVAHRVGVEHAVVAALVRPAVGVVEREEQHPRPRLLQVGHGQPERERVVPRVVPWRTRLRLQLVQQPEIGAIEGQRRVAGIDRRGALGVFGDGGEDVPARDGGDLRPRQLQIAPQPLEHRFVRVADRIVRRIVLSNAWPSRISA